MDSTKKEGVVWKPMPGKVIVKKIENDRETFQKGGKIIRPATSVQPRTTGEVIAVFDPYTETDGHEFEPICQPGDIVIFGKNGGIEIGFGEETIICLRETEILTRVEISDPTTVSVVPGEFDSLDERTPEE